MGGKQQQQQQQQQQQHYYQIEEEDEEHPPISPARPPRGRGFKSEEFYTKCLLCLFRPYNPY